LLGLNRLQIVHLHDPEHTTFEEAMAKGGPVETLVELKEAGIIEHLGVAGGPVDMMIRYVQTGCFEVAITHNRYTLLDRSAEPLLKTAARLGVAVLNAAPYGGGILARGPEEYPRYAYKDASRELIERARRIGVLCESYGVPLPAAALQFSLRERRIASTIVGVSSPEHVRATLELASTPIPEELWAEIEATAPDS
ncbi:MAG: aldo/keto reductase, partial [Rubrobacteraceae bacterium]|nr:aldo/keto reductase [Rubrobacteraceae bacterium]